MYGLRNKFFCNRILIGFGGARDEETGYNLIKFRLVSMSSKVDIYNFDKNFPLILLTGH